MMIARWEVQARFGHKQEVLQLIRQWEDKFGSRIGWSHDKVRITTNAIGGPESRVTTEVKVESLAELNDSFEKLATLDGHAEWGRKLEPLIVSGSNHWEVERVL